MPIETASPPVAKGRQRPDREPRIIQPLPCRHYLEAAAHLVGVKAGVELLDSHGYGAAASLDAAATSSSNESK